MIESSKKAPRKRKQYTAPALEKGLDVLELLSLDASGSSLSEIASQLKRSVGEIFRMVVVLEQRGYVAPVLDTDRYALTGKMLTVAHGYAPVQSVTSVSGEVMRTLARETGQGCHLVVYHDGRGVIVAQQNGPTDRGLMVQLGAEAPLTNTCSGHVLLAFANAKERKTMMAERPSRFKTRISKKQLDDVLSSVVARGYELIDSGQVEGVKDIGFPIVDWIGRVQGVLVIPFLKHIDGSNRVGIRTATEKLSSAAAEISSLLGHRSTEVAKAK